MIKEMDLTKGSILKTVFAFSIPFLLANIIQALYGAVDLMVVGKYCTSDSVSAVSTGTQVTQIITSIISGLSVGATVLVGRYKGMKKYDDIKSVIGTNLTLFIITAIILTILMIVFSENILIALKTPKEAFSQAKDYVFICSCGIIFICGYNAISAVLRGYGDSKSPLIFVFIAGCINIIGDIILVKYFNMGVKGTAFATIFSQGLSMFCAIIYLNSKNFIFKFKISNFKISKQKLKELGWVSIPIFFQECMVRLSFLYLTAVTNNLGVNASSAVGIASKYDVFAMLPATSVASALTAIVSQNYGAKEYKRMTKSLFVGIALALPISMIFFIWAQFSPESMIGIFSNDKDIISTGIPFFKMCSYDYIFVLFVFCMNGYLNGRSKTIFTMISCCFGAIALRMPIIYYVCVNYPNDIKVVGMAAPFVSFVMAVYTFIYILYLYKKDKKIKF